MTTNSATRFSNNILSEEPLMALQSRLIHSSNTYSDCASYNSFDPLHSSSLHVVQLWSFWSTQSPHTHPQCWWAILPETSAVTDMRVMFAVMILGRVHAPVTVQFSSAERSQYGTVPLTVKPQYCSAYTAVNSGSMIDHNIQTHEIRTLPDSSDQRCHYHEAWFLYIHPSNVSQ
jgi:hypothetical protein